MSLCRKQGFVEAPVEVVWDLIVDVERHPEWWPRVIEVECEGLDEGCTYRQVTQTPIGKDEMNLLVENRDELRNLRIRCINTGTFVRFALTGAQDGTFVEGEMGMDPINLRSKVIDVVVGKRYFSEWLGSTMEALRRVAADRAERSGNVEIVRRGFAALAEGEFDRIFAALADDVRWEGVPGADPCRNRREVEETIRANYEAGADTRAEEFIGAGDNVLVRLRMNGDVLPGPYAGRDENYIVFTLREGKVKMMRDFLDRDTALAAAGTDDRTA